MKQITAVLMLLLVLLFSCTKDDDSLEPIVPEPQTPADTTGTSDLQVNFNLDEVPYNTLSEYNFFEGNMTEFIPVDGVLPYNVISSLFTDYAKKKRFVWMPPGVSSTFDEDGKILNFDDGAVLIKHFYYENVQPQNNKRIIETRIMFKKDGEWIFANYIWNNEQSEAFLDLNGGYTSVDWLDDNNNLRSINYRIPSESECFTCHKLNDEAIPIGPKPQNINSLYTYSEGVKNQLEKWEEMGYLNPGYPINIETVVDWQDDTESLSKRIRSYIDANCSHCHQAESHCDYRPIRFAYSETTIPENLGICVEPDQGINSTLTHIIAPEKPERSVAHFRMNTTDEALQMPLLGRSIVHDEGVELLVEYINSLSPC